MRRVFLLLFLLFEGCVQIPEEEMTFSVPSEEVVVPETVPVQDAALLAPLPELPKNATPPPSSPLPQPTPQQKSMPSGWTTEPISIEEGETKVVYVKQ